ncbi:MAG: hypothetical protein KDK36_01160 [Leptospiraceae bacterium]|nr:hypothetical protein [Leptospiraceae bacterium]
MKKILLSIPFLIFLAGKVFAVSPDMYNIKNLIEENRKHFEFINVAISNMIPPKKDKDGNPAPPEAEPEPEKKHDRNKELDSSYYFDYLNANQKDFEGNIYFFKGDYGLAHPPLREAEGRLKTIYESVLERHTEYTRVMATYAGNRIIRSRDFSAKHLLKLALKQLKLAEDFYTMGWNTSPYKYRDKIYYYQDGIAASRRARRFIILALIEFKTPEDEKRVFKKEKLNEYKDPSYDGSVNHYEYLKNTLRNHIENKWLEPKISANVPFERPDTATNFTFVANVSPPIDLMEVLDDCYGIITYNRISVLEETNNFLNREMVKEEKTATPEDTSPPKDSPTSSPEPEKK